MTTSYQALVTIVIAFLLAGCAHQCCKTSPAKNPCKIALLEDKQMPTAPYRIIGVATVAKRDRFGIQNNVNNMMKNFAASIGGDAVMNLSSKGNQVRANVIQYQRILI